MKYKNVFIFGIDGAGTAPFHTECPNIRRILEWGGKLECGKTVFPSISAECWGSLLLAVSPKLHGYNNDLVTDTKAYLKCPYKTVLSIIKEKYPQWEIASFSSWESINIGIIEDITDIKKESYPDEKNADKCAEYIRKSGNGAVFMQLDDVDHAGHVNGFCSSAYYEQMRLTDSYIGRVLDAIEDSGKRENSLIFVVADHGGGGGDKYSHGSEHDLDMDIFILAYDGEKKESSFEIKRITDIVPHILRCLEIEMPEYMENEKKRS